MSEHWRKAALEAIDSAIEIVRSMGQEDARFGNGELSSEFLAVLHHLYNAEHCLLSDKERGDARGGPASETKMREMLELANMTILSLLTIWPQHWGRDQAIRDGAEKAQKQIAAALSTPASTAKEITELELAGLIYRAGLNGVTDSNTLARIVHAEIWGNGRAAARG